MTKPKPKCPECSKPFATVQLLAMHRKRAHDVAGTSKSHLQAQRHKAEIAARAAATATTETVQQTSDLVSQSTIIRRESHERQQTGAGLSCDQCGFIAATAGGLRVHVSIKHRQETSAETQMTTTTTTGGTSIERTQTTKRNYVRRQQQQEDSEADRDGIPEATLALALGRFQGLCASMALEFDLPPRRLAARLAQLIYATQVR